MSEQNERIALIESLLTEHLAPTLLEITDDSHKHAGHIGNQGGGHYAIAIASPRFSNKSRLAAHRLIYEALQSLMPEQIHALQIIIRS